MRYRMILLMSALLIGLTAFSGSASAFSFFTRWGRRDASREAVTVRNDSHRMTRQRIRGRVVRVSGQIAYVRTSPFHVVRVQLGPEAYWEAYGYRLVPGEYITVSGWCDPDEHSGLYFAGTIWAPGFSFTLTNDVGAPLWVTDYDYDGRWYPTYQVYETWYRPSYHYEREGHPPGHHAAPPGHEKRGGRRHGEGRGHGHGD